MKDDAPAKPSAGLSSKLKFEEVRGDLFSSPKTASLAHCVSEDLRMGKGIAVAFKKTFGGVEELKQQGVCEYVYVPLRFTAQIGRIIR